MIYSHFSHLCLLDFTIFDNRPPSQTFKTDSMSSSSLIGFKTQLAYCINGLCAEYAFHPQLMATSESSHPLLCTANPQPRDACCQNPWSDTLESASCWLCSGCAVMQTKGFLTAPSNCQRQAGTTGRRLQQWCTRRTLFTHTQVVNRFSNCVCTFPPS